MSSLLDKISERRKEREKKLKPFFDKQYKYKYITGNSAFNIPHEGVQLDWHQVDMLDAMRFLEHPVNYIGAEEIFGDYGVWDCTDWFKSKGKDKQSLCATPIRAILDTLYFLTVVHNQYPSLFNDFNDYMVTEINYGELSSKLDIMKAKVSPEQRDWLIKWERKNIIDWVEP